MRTTAMKLDWHWSTPKEKISRLVATQAIKHLTEYGFNNDDAKFYFREYRDGFFYHSSLDMWVRASVDEVRCLADGKWILVSFSPEVTHEIPKMIPLKEVERIALRMITISTD